MHGRIESEQNVKEAYEHYVTRFNFVSYMKVCINVALISEDL